MDASSPSWRTLLLVVGFLALLVQGCRKQAPLATLERSTGGVERDRRASVNRWDTAQPGAEFDYGDGLKTGSPGTAFVRMFDRSALVLEPKTLIRFLERPSGGKGAKIDVEMGSATLEAGDAALDVDLAWGTARLESHAKLRLERDGDALRLEVLIGSARMLGEKEILELTVGDAVEILPDRTFRKQAAAADVTDAAAAPSALPVPADSALLPGTAPSTSGSASAVPGAPPAGPDVIDFSVSAGDSFVVHDGKPPTAIAFGQSKCAGPALLTVTSSRGGRKETLGGARVSATFAAGTHRYTVSCFEAGKPGPAVAQGTVTVLTDSGARTLAKTAPATTVDADGRRYTVLYQSLLPKISVRWPNAPEASTYTLRVRSASATRTFTSGTPSHGFAAGALAEGEHSVVFEGGGKRSKETGISVRFDNAAPTASISGPADGSFAAGATTLVSGAALPGWSVSVGGKELEQDAQNRFSGDVSAPAGQRALAIRFSHAGRGVHYYVKRSAGQ